MRSRERERGARRKGRQERQGAPEQLASTYMGFSYFCAVYPSFGGFLLSPGPLIYASEAEEEAGGGKEERMNRLLTCALDVCFFSCLNPYIHVYIYSSPLFPTSASVPESTLLPLLIF